MQIHARPIGPDDRQVVAQLLAGSAMATGAERGGPLFALREGVGDLVGPTLESFLSEAGVFAAVGLVDDVVLGVALARLETLRDGSLLARLEHLWVEPGAREVGLGESMLQLVSSWAQEGGAHHLDAYALPGNRESKNFLESAGFAARLIVMSRILP